MEMIGKKRKAAIDRNREGFLYLTAYRTYTIVVCLKRFPFKCSCHKVAVPSDERSLVEIMMKMVTRQKGAAALCVVYCTVVV